MMEKESIEDIDRKMIEDEFIFHSDVNENAEAVSTSPLWWRILSAPFKIVFIILVIIGKIAWWTMIILLKLCLTAFYLCKLVFYLLIAIPLSPLILLGYIMYALGKRQFKENEQFILQIPTQIIASILKAFAVWTRDGATGGDGATGNEYE